MNEETQTHPRRKERHGKKHNCSKCNGCSHPISQSQGELVITAVRNKFSLPYALPYCIWGSLYSNTNYGVILQPYLPVAVPAITVTTANVGGNVVFTYTDGIETDTITVSVPSIGLISYLEILSNLKTNYMRTCFMTFNCNAALDALTWDDQQIATLQSGGLFIQEVGGTGNKDAQLIIPFTRKQINNSVSNIIEIYLRNEPVKPESVWVHQFAYIVQAPAPVTPMLFSHTIFISERVNMNEEKTSAIRNLIN